jgi:hypothetical protein
MMTSDLGALPKWALRSLLLVAILAAPAAYSEVIPASPDRAHAGTLLGNYLAGRVARGNHDTRAAAEFYSKALAGDPDNELILEQAFLLEHLGGRKERRTNTQERTTGTSPGT